MQKPLLAGFSFALCFTALVCVLWQRGQLADLRAEQQRLVAAAVPPVNEPAVQETTRPVAPAQPSPTLLKLLRLRNQAGQLASKMRELAVVAQENQRLQTLLATQLTNRTASVTLPQDYIRTSLAQWRGTTTPEDTLQSFLWAIQHRDVTNFARMLKPESAERLFRNKSADNFFDDFPPLPGVRIVGRQELPDGSVELRVEVVPGEPLPGGGKIHFRQIAGEWKMDDP